MNRCTPRLPLPLLPGPLTCLVSTPESKLMWRQEICKATGAGVRIGPAVGAWICERGDVMKSLYTVSIRSSKAFWSVQLHPPATRISPTPPFSTPSVCVLATKCLNQLHFLSLQPQLSRTLLPSYDILDCMSCFLPNLHHISVTTP